MLCCGRTRPAAVLFVSDLVSIILKVGAAQQVDGFDNVLCTMVMMVGTVGRIFFDGHTFFRFYDFFITFQDCF